MYFKMAIKNVKRSFKDYTIYFLTLTFAVCIFYSFNSIESQKAILQINKTQSENIDLLMNMMSILSVFVSIILGSLIIYANNFLIKKRKKELGIYMTLGMSKQRMSRILLLETLVIGVISLVVGLIIGIVASQGLSAFTAKLFQVGMSQYKFIISTSAIGKTILYFSLMFILVMIFNTVAISRYKLIDMLNAAKKNEDIKIKNPIISIIIFVIGVISLIVAYKLVSDSGLDYTTIEFKLSIVLGTLGTFLFFYGLGGFVLDAIKKNKSIYFRNINIFITKQINSKINTNFLSMTVICLMLFLTIGMLSTGLSLKDAIEKGLEETTPFDASASIYNYEDSIVTTMEEAFEKLNYKFKDNQEHIFYNEYTINASGKEMLGKYVNESSAVYRIAQIDTATAINISDYNSIRKLKGKKPLILKDNEVLVASNNDAVKDVVEAFANSGNPVMIDGKEYILKDKELVTESFYTVGNNANFFTLIVPDSVTKDLIPSASFININYLGDNNTREEAENEFSNLFNSLLNGEVNYDDYGFFMIGYTKQEILESNRGLTAMVLYIGLYLGIVFLISSAAVLALQQLSEASDSSERYKSLKRIGATNKMINRSIFIQTLIYFMVPLTLAIVHSIIGIGIVNKFISAFGKPDIGVSAMVTTLIIAIVYGGYFYATYTGYKNIVKSNI